MSLQRTRALIQKDEGRRKKIYKDSEGLLTIGVGRLLDPSKPGAGLSDDEIDYLFRNDFTAALDGAKGFTWFHELTACRKAVIVSMCFQLGTFGVVKFKKMIRALKARDYTAAAREMKDSVWHKQTPGRCRRLAKMMATNQWDPRLK